jgi:hypothetical protein
MAAESSDVAGGAAPPCWICKTHTADSGEHKTKRSDLLAVLGKPSQREPLFYHDLHKRNQSVGSLDAKILKNPVVFAPTATMRAPSLTISPGRRCPTGCGRAG